MTARKGGLIGKREDSPPPQLPNHTEDTLDHAVLGATRYDIGGRRLSLAQMYEPRLPWPPTAWVVKWLITSLVLHEITSAIGEFRNLERKS